MHAFLCSNTLRIFLVVFTSISKLWHHLKVLILRQSHPTTMSHRLSVSQARPNQPQCKSIFSNILLSMCMILKQFALGLACKSRTALTLSGMTRGWYQHSNCKSTQSSSRHSYLSYFNHCRKRAPIKNSTQQCRGKNRITLHAKPAHYHMQRKCAQPPSSHS